MYADPSAWNTLPCTPVVVNGAPLDLVQFTDVFSVSCLVLSENLD